MAKLTFSGRSDDSGHLILTDDVGQTFTLAVDARLKKALAGAPDRTGQLEIQMESALRPRDIQARIRAGETPEAVAQAAGSDVEKIMPYAAPVLAERAHVAQRAQLSSVRSRSGDHRTLGEAVTAHLRGLNTVPDSVEWDAWRREDGRWTLTGQFASSERSGTASYSFDMRGNFVTMDDDDARWLVGDLPAATPAAEAAPAPSSAPAGVEAGDDLAAARRRRLSAVQTDELPLGDDAIEMVTGPGPNTGPGPDTGPEQADPTETTLEFAADDSAVGTEQPVEAYLDGDGATEDSAEVSPGQDSQPAAPAPSEGAADPASDEPPTRKTKRRGRASVPSWDEIMFGGGKGD